MEDATKSGVTANSYATATEADDLLDVFYGAEDWLSVSDDDKSRLLITATSMLDELKLQYGLYSVDPLQALNFPLVTPVPGDDGFDKVKMACIHQAFHIFENNDTIREARAGKIQGIRQEQIAKMKKISFGFNPWTKYSTKALKLLSSYIDMSVKIGRG